MPAAEDEVVARRPKRLGLLKQLARLGLGNVVPFSLWRADRPWSIPGVQWFLFFTLFPLFLVTWTAVFRPGFDDVALLFAIYFATLSGLVLWLFVRPERIGMLDIGRITVFTSVTGVFLVQMLERLPLVRLFAGAAREPQIAERFALGG